MGARCRAVGHDRQRQAEDPGQGGHHAGPAAPDLRGQAARGRSHAVGLQHPEGVDAPPGAPPARRFLKARSVVLGLRVLGGAVAVSCRGVLHVAPCGLTCASGESVGIRQFGDNKSQREAAKKKKKKKRGGEKKKKKKKKK